MATPDVELHEQTDILQFRDPNQPNFNLVYWTLDKLGKKENANVIFWVHGIGEHSARVKIVAKTLLSRCPKLDAFMSFDLRGHGKSEGGRGVTTGLVELAKDIKDFVLPHMALHYGNTSNIMLAGHSLGGSILLQMLIDQHEDFLKAEDYGQIIGCSLSAPAIKIPIQGFFNKLLAPAASAIVAIPGMRKFTKPNEMDFSQLSHDPKIKDENDKDELIHNKLSFGLGADMLAISTKVTNKIHNDNDILLKKIPIWIIHSADDQITDIEGSKEVIEDLKKSNSNQPATLVEMTKAKHEMMFELDEYGRKDFFDRFVEHINETIDHVQS